MLKKKIGFLLSHLGDRELSNNFIKQANEFISREYNVDRVDIIAFVNNQAKPVSHPSFSCMNINEAFDFSGIVVATDIDTAEQLLGFPGRKKMIYYLWELDWIKNKTRTFEEMSYLYTNQRLTLAARSESDKKLIEQCWNTNVQLVVPNFEIKEFLL